MKLKDWAERLIWATVLISVVRYAAAFAASDVGQITGVWSSVLTFFLSVTGLGMGVLDTIGGGLLFNGWSKVLPRHGTRGSARFNILSICVFTLLVSGLFILVPFTMSRLSHESVLDALGGKNSFWAWMWSLMVNLIPYVLIAGVFVGNKMVTSLETEDGEQRTNNERTDIKTNAWRTNNERTENSVRDQIRKYVLTTQETEKRTPGPTEVSRELGVSKGYVSDVMKNGSGYKQ